MEQYEELISVAGYYRILLIANAVISTPIYTFLLYMVVFISPKTVNHCVRCNLLNLLTTSYVQCVFLALWQPIPLFPLAGRVSLRSCSFKVCLFQVASLWVRLAPSLIL